MAKTFEDMIDNSPLLELLSIPEKDLVIDLMRQVREATIKECWFIAISNKQDETAKDLMELRKDRIKV